jgi:hypothetical protein
MHQSTVKDFPGLDLGHTRRNDRFVSIINNLNEQPGSSIPKFIGTWYDTKATYSLFKNEDVNITAIQKAIGGFGSNLVKAEDKL